jgi:hypothetical protein
MAVAGDLMFLKRQDGRFSVAIACTELADTTDTANVIIRPPNAWAVAVLAGLAINWLMPLPFVPAAVSAGWLGAIVFALALALVAWAIAIITWGRLECAHQPADHDLAGIVLYDCTETGSK